MIAISLTSSTLCLFSNSWLILWILLEMNTLSFCSLSFISSNNSSNNSNQTINYLVIQSTASSVLIVTAILPKTNNSNVPAILILAGTSALMLNIASAPLHGWFLKITNIINWNNAFFLITWQNVAPLIILTSQSKLPLAWTAALCALVGSSPLVNNTNIKEILALSSVFNLSWIILAINSSWALVTFVILYWSTLGFVFQAVQGSVSDSANGLENTNNDNPMIPLYLINLGGLPPLAGFTAKLMVLKTAIKIEKATLITVVLTATAINLYAYLRTTVATTANENTHTNKINPNNVTAWSFIVISILPIQLTLT